MVADSYTMLLGGDKMELLDQINELLQQGLNVEEASMKIGKGKEWARRELSKQGYKHDRKTNQYIPKTTTAISGDTTETTMTPNIADVREKKQVTEVAKDSYPFEQLKNEDILILHKIISEYRLREEIRNTNTEEDRLDNRNVRVYVKHYNNFANWCKEINVT